MKNPGVKVFSLAYNPIECREYEPILLYIQDDWHGEIIDNKVTLPVIGLQRVLSASKFDDYIEIIVDVYPTHQLYKTIRESVKQPINVINAYRDRRPD